MLEVEKLPVGHEFLSSLRTLLFLFFFLEVGISEQSYCIFYKWQYVS